MKPIYYYIAIPLCLSLILFSYLPKSEAASGTTTSASSPSTTSATNTSTTSTTTKTATSTTTTSPTNSSTAATGTTTTSPNNSSTPAATGTTNAAPTNSSTAASGTAAKTSSPSTTTPTPPQAAVQVYTDPVKVDLSDLGEISVTPTGNYQLVNLDTQSTIPISGPVDLVEKLDAKGLLWVHEQGINQSSKKGFALQELAGSSSPDFMTIFPAAASSNQDYVYRGSLTVTPNKIYNTLGMEDYLKGVIPREMPASWPIEALKAQAIACRNYAYDQMKASGFVYSDQRSQVYGGMSAEYPQSNAAVEATKGLIMYYGSTPISAYFSSSNGGHTAIGPEVWSGNPPYLVSKSDPYDSYKNPYENWNQQIQTNTIDQALGLKSGELVVKLTTSKTTSYSRVQEVTATVLNTLTGDESTQVLPNGVPDNLRSTFGTSLKSTMFTLTPQDSTAQVMQADGTVKTYSYLAGGSIMQADGTKAPLSGSEIAVNDIGSTTDQQPLYPTYYTFNGHGFGHGLGLSQYGAYGMSAQGKTYKDILNFYYNGITIQSLPS